MIYGRSTAFAGLAGSHFTVPQIHPSPAIPRKPLCEPAAPATSTFAPTQAAVPAPEPIGARKTL